MDTDSPPIGHEIRVRAEGVGKRRDRKVPDQLIRALLAGGYTRQETVDALNCTRERVDRIAAGHAHSRRLRKLPGPLAKPGPKPHTARCPLCGAKILCCGECLAKGELAKRLGPPGDRLPDGENPSKLFGRGSLDVEPLGVDLEGEKLERYKAVKARRDACLPDDADQPDPDLSRDEWDAARQRLAGRLDPPGNSDQAEAPPDSPPE